LSESGFFCLNQDLQDLQDFQDKVKTFSDELGFNPVNPVNPANPDSDKIDTKKAPWYTCFKAFLDEMSTIQ